MSFNRMGRIFYCVTLRACSGTEQRMSTWFSRPRTWVDGNKRWAFTRGYTRLWQPRYQFKAGFWKNYPNRYIIKPGKYLRTLSFSEAIESIKDPNAIVVTVDLHLDIGSQFINDVCKVRRSERNMFLDLGPVSGKSR